MSGRTDMVIATRIEADSSGANQSVESFRSQLKRATDELITMNQKFGSTSAEAKAAADKVAQLKDAIGDAKQLSDTFDPDKKFVAFGQAVNGVISGFAGLQGAMGLFGVQSQEVEKTLLKVQSAMALQQGLAGCFNLLTLLNYLPAILRRMSLEHLHHYAPQSLQPA